MCVLFITRVLRGMRTLTHGNRLTKSVWLHLSLLLTPYMVSNSLPIATVTSMMFIFIFCASYCIDYLSYPFGAAAEDRINALDSKLGLASSISVVAI